MSDLKEKDLEKVVGGMPDEEFQSLEIGARVQVIQGPYANKCGTVYGFVDDLKPPYKHLVAGVTLDDGTNEYFSGDEIARA